MDTLGKRLRESLRIKNIKQIQLAKSIGITPASLSQFCSDIVKPSLRTSRDICNALNINEQWLLTGEGPINKETPQTITDALAQEYGLQPYAAKIVNAVAQSVKVLSDEQLKMLVDRLIAEIQHEHSKNTKANKEVQ